MKKYRIQLYKMKYVGEKYSNFKPRYYYQTFISLSELAKYVCDNRLFMSELFEHICYQLTRKEVRILNGKIWAMAEKFANKSTPTN